MLINWFYLQADIPASALALQSITEASSGSPENGWEVGWSLASHGNGPQPIMDAIQKEVSWEEGFPYVFFFLNFYERNQFILLTQNLFDFFILFIYLFYMNRLLYHRTRMRKHQLNFKCNIILTIYGLCIETCL